MVLIVVLLAALDAACSGSDTGGFFAKVVLRVYKVGDGRGTVTFGTPFAPPPCTDSDRQDADFCTSFEDAGGGGSVNVTASPEPGSVLGEWFDCESTTGLDCVMAFDRAPASVVATVRFDLEPENSCPNIVVPPKSSLGLKNGPRPGPATPVPNDPAAWSGTNYLADPDFEQELVFRGRTTGTGYWAFDEAWSAPTGQQGIAAQSGSRMLHFVSSSQDGSAPTTTSSEQIQLVDVSALRERIDAGQVEAEASAFFNRVASGECTRIDDAFGIRVSAHAGIPADFNVHLGFAEGRVTGNDAPADWQQGSAVLTLPTGTTYISVRLFINEGAANNDFSYPEFHGHYADNASLTVRLKP